jgi:hypothetical protein
MCGSSPPTPKAPPAPIPQRDTGIDGLRSRQLAAAQSATGGYDSTMLTGANGAATPANIAAPKLGT